MSAVHRGPEALLQAAAGERLSTGLPTLDSLLRGGIPLRKRIALLGEPGAGKTTLAAQWALAWAIAGKSVVYVARDEEPAGILVRWGQSLLCDGADMFTDSAIREMLEAGDPDIVAAFAAQWPATLGYSDELTDAECDVLIVDSLQECAPERTREGIERALSELKRLSESRLVIVLSEMARGAYAAKDKGERTRTLAAGKESGAIEYWAHAQFSIVDNAINIDKARFGAPGCKGQSVGLALNSGTARFREKDAPPEDTRPDTKRIDSIAERIASALADYAGPPMTTRAVRNALTAAGAKVRSDDIGPGLLAGERLGLFRNEGSEARAGWVLVRKNPVGSQVGITWDRPVEPPSGGCASA